MNINRCYNVLFPIFVLSLFLLNSCRFMTPVKEMSLAKSAITGAEEVKADKYAPEELKNAKDALLGSHDFVMSEDADKAKAEAEKAMGFADDAIAKSLPLLAKDTLDEAKKIYGEADSAFAEKYASEDFKIAGDHINGAEGLMNESKFRDSYLKSREAIVFSTSARDKALANIAALKESLGRIKEEAKKLEDLGGRDFAPEEMGIIDSCTAGADSLIGQNNLKDAVVKIKEADDALKIAALKTLKGVAAERIKTAENKLEEVKKSEKKELIIQDIEKAAGLIAVSKELYGKESYEESGVKSLEALDILNSISISQEKQSEEIRIEEEKLQSGAEVYVVKLNPEKRDCLWRIAMYTYKDAKLWPLIYMANRDKIKDPDLIFPGQKLTIPSINGVKKSDQKDIEGKIIKEETPAEEKSPVEKAPEDNGSGKEIPAMEKDGSSVPSTGDIAPSGEESPAVEGKSVNAAESDSGKSVEEESKDEDDLSGSRPVENENIESGDVSDDASKDSMNEDQNVNGSMDDSADKEIGEDVEGGSNEDMESPTDEKTEE